MLQLSPLEASWGENPNPIFYKTIFTK